MYLHFKTPLAEVNPWLNGKDVYRLIKAAKVYATRKVAFRFSVRNLVHKGWHQKVCQQHKIYRRKLSYVS